MKNKLFFTFIEGLSVKKILLLEKYFGGLDEAIKADEKMLTACGVLTEKNIQKILQKKKEIDIDKELYKLMNKNVRVTFYGEADYPGRLYDIASPPWGLYYINNIPSDSAPVVSIIGARSCSEYGKSCARYFSSELAKKGVQVVSGMASGIDGIAQRQAVSIGKSFGVLGCGVDVCYPLSNRDLYDELKRSGGILSEYPLGTKPEAYRFPQRNRIISGLSDIVLVIEAKEKSGTAITVTMALEQGKDVFAVPGRINDRLSDGCNNLIKEGAGIAITVDDILSELEVMKECNVFKKRSEIMKNNIKTYENCSSQKLSLVTSTNYNKEQDYDFDVITKLISDKNMSIDEIYEKGCKVGFCEIKSSRDLSIKLAEMELEGSVINKNGWYELN